MLGALRLTDRGTNKVKMSQVNGPIPISWLANCLTTSNYAVWILKPPVSASLAPAGLSIFGTRTDSQRPVYFEAFTPPVR